MSSEIVKVAELIASSRGNVVLFTGAGISTESGIPDFRGPKGLWKRISPEIFSIEFFQEDPDFSWKKYLEEVYVPISRASPNSAHYAVAKLEAGGLVKGVITQNIDRLHQKAGSRNVIELHGRFDEVQCLRCSFRGDLKKFVEEVKKSEKAPRCPRCSSILKPAVVYFGEPLPEKELLDALSMARSSSLLIIIGTSLAVYPAALIPQEAIRTGAKAVVINDSPTPIDGKAELVVRRKAGEILPEVAKMLVVEKNEETA